MHVFIPFVFRPQVANESIEAVGPEGRNNPSRCREAPEIVFSEIVRALKSRQEIIRDTALFAMGRFFDENPGIPIDVPDTLVHSLNRALLNCECSETDSPLHGVDSRRRARSLLEQFLEARA